MEIKIVKCSKNMKKKRKKIFLQKLYTKNHIIIHFTKNYIPTGFFDDRNTAHKNIATTGQLWFNATIELMYDLHGFRRFSLFFGDFRPLDLED